MTTRVESRWRSILLLRIGVGPEEARDALLPDVVRQDGSSLEPVGEALGYRHRHAGNPHVPVPLVPVDRDDQLGVQPLALLSFLKERAVIGSL